MHVYVFLHGNKADFSFNYFIYKTYISFQFFCLFLFKFIVKLQWLSLKEPIATSPAFPETPEILRLSRNISFCLSLNPSLSISPSILFFFTLAKAYQSLSKINLHYYLQKEKRKKEEK